MFDLFEYPTITSTDPKEQIKELQHYLVQFKETLEFALTNISTDNLSGDLITQLNTLGADIKNSNEERDDQLQQVASKSITVSDVLNSASYKASLQAVEDKIPSKFTINFETGNLEYE